MQLGVATPYVLDMWIFPRKKPSLQASSLRVKSCSLTRDAEEPKRLGAALNTVLARALLSFVSAVWLTAEYSPNDPRDVA